MAARAQNVKSAALMRPIESSGEVKFNRVVAIVPMKTEMLSHFYMQETLQHIFPLLEGGETLTKKVRSAAK